MKGAEGLTAIDTAQQVLLTGVLIVLAVLVLCTLARAIIGPRIADRILSINMIGTLIMMIISILSVLLGADYLIDIAVVYAMISLLSVVILSKVYMGVHLENKQKSEREER